MGGGQPAAGAYQSLTSRTKNVNCLTDCGGGDRALSLSSE